MYLMMQKVTRYMDQYHLDGIAGLVPGGLGDIASAIVALVHIYFGMFRLRSIPLTLAILNNVLRDVLMGMLPFFVGDIIDFLNKAHKKNMKLIDGYLDDDAAIIQEVNRKAWQSAAILIVLILAIVGMVWVLIWLTKTLGTVIFS
ncbi:MAG: DUF4112 domain-containing protein [Prevotella sp.]|nr:DUF4112 domain-containing protein [Prevotella sp.]